MMPNLILTFQFQLLLNIFVLSLLFRSKLNDTDKNGKTPLHSGKNLSINKRFK
jgi:hypothetical protein